MINLVKINTNYEKFTVDIADVIRAFDNSMQLFKGEDEEYYSFNINCKIDKKIDFIIETDLIGKNIKDCFEYENLETDSKLKLKSHFKYCLKAAVYEACKKAFGHGLPYGSLTGIRPTKLYRNLIDENRNAYDVFIEDYKVTKDKTGLVKSIVELQENFLNYEDKNVDVFVNIPFCPSRCIYCSFVTTDINKLRKYVDRYVELLKNEISIIKNIIKENTLTVRAVYVGGGTPSCLPINLLAEILDEIKFDSKEFTVEAGRPDTITKELLDMFVEKGVTRISINPQTFNQKTLDLVGRKHSIAQIYEAYGLAKNYPFKINMDLIALLPNESYDDFIYSVKSALKLKPDNLTIHTLTVKRGSVLKNKNYANNDSKTANNMIDTSRELLLKEGYVPYYMYRQKNMCANLENTGYTLNKNDVCIYNIDIMEENTSIMACGAGSISKRIFRDEHRLERYANMKNVCDYIERFDKQKMKIENFWK